MINTQVTDLTWLTRRLQETQLSIKVNMKAEDVDEFEEDVNELVCEGTRLEESRHKAFDNLLVRLRNKEQS